MPVGVGDYHRIYKVTDSCKAGRIVSRRRCAHAPDFGVGLEIDCKRR